ncbi:hypothetical protein BHM03_00055844 [Ensete ventricosum]|nr:hypothetical protein BHM03_00055844 [Ensete ventricosum]
MVQLPDAGKRRVDSAAHAAPEAAAVKLEIEDPLDDEHGPLNKRSKDASPPNQQVDRWLYFSGRRCVIASIRISLFGRKKLIYVFSQLLHSVNCMIIKGVTRTSDPALLQAMYYNVLEEPGPLGLRLRKSPSLADLIQMRLSQAKSGGASCATSLGSSEVGDNKELKSSAASSSLNKIKASNFPATLLRIGTWECVSRYEGDLVAKCYFAKHKLVWEVLEGGLKSKIEFHWSDITAIKATFSEGGHGTLDIVVGFCLVHGIDNLSSGSLNFFSKYEHKFITVGVEVRSTEENNTSKETEERGPDWWEQLKLPGLRGSMSMTDLVNHLGQHISEQMTSVNPSLPSDALPNKEVLEDIAQYLLNDSQSAATSDEQSIISRVNSLCCLLQKDNIIGTMQKSQTKDTDEAQVDAGSDDELVDAAQPPITRKESFGELLILPRIASMPKFLFNISEDEEKEIR